MSEKNYIAIWEEALNQIQEEFKQSGKENDFKIWFKMNYIEDTMEEITVSVPSDFMWIQMNQRGFVSLIENKIEQLIGQHISIKHIVDNKTENKPYSIENDENLKRPEKKEEVAPVHMEEKKETSEEKPSFIKKHPLLDDKMTFENFVTGPNSEFAYSASLRVAEEPGTVINPLFIYGGVGLGKTHLMESIGNFIYQNHPEYKICYISAENFANEFTKSLRDKKDEDFKNKFRNLDVLLVDDIHFFIGKKGIQEELFYTFEALSRRKAQMVFTCDRPLSELKGIEERIISRFSKGTTIDLAPPNYETRLAILQKKIEFLNQTKGTNYEIPADILEYIANNVQSNVRELEGCLTKIILYIELTNKPLTIQTVQEQLRDHFGQSVSGSLSIDTIQKAVADHFNISLADLKGKSKKAHIVQARQYAIYIARELGDYSYPELGEEFGGRDHTTILYSYNEVANKIILDPTIKNTIELLKREAKEYRKTI